MSPNCRFKTIQPDEKAYWTIRRQTNSQSVKSRTGQLADSEFVNIIFGVITIYTPNFASNISSSYPLQSATWFTVSRFVGELSGYHEKHQNTTIFNTN